MGIELFNGNSRQSASLVTTLMAEILSGATLLLSQLKSMTLWSDFSKTLRKPNVAQSHTRSRRRAS